MIFLEILKPPHHSAQYSGSLQDILELAHILEEAKQPFRVYPYINHQAATQEQLGLSGFEYWRGPTE
jgi:hypothetical protein